MVFLTVANSEELLVDARGGGRTPIEFSWLSGLDPSNDRVFLVASETPIRLAPPLDQRRLEEVHLTSYAEAHLRFAGDKPIAEYLAVEDDPPDFMVKTEPGGHALGLECVSFTGYERRRRYARFRAVERALLAHPEGRRGFTHIENRVALLGFPDGMPPWSETDPVTQEVVEALAVITPDPAHDVVVGRRARVVWPRELPSGVRVDLPRITGRHSPSEFHQHMGFELALMESHEWQSSQVRKQLDELVRRKDRDGNDWVLVTAGGPGGDGYALPGDDLRGQVAVRSFGPLSDLEHISRVIVHCCISSEAWEVYPRKRLLFRNAATGPLKGPAGFFDPTKPQAERNDPCPCRSGQKYKRCCTPDLW